MMLFSGVVWIVGALIDRIAGKVDAKPLWAWFQLTHVDKYLLYVLGTWE